MPELRLILIYIFDRVWWNKLSLFIIVRRYSIDIKGKAMWKYRPKIYTLFICCSSLNYILTVAIRFKKKTFLDDKEASLDFYFLAIFHVAPEIYILKIFKFVSNLKVQNNNFYQV